MTKIKQTRALDTRVPVKCYGLGPPLPLTDDKEQRALLVPSCHLPPPLAESLHVIVNSSLGMWLHPGVVFPGLRSKHVTTWPGSPASLPGDADRICGAGSRALELIGNGIWGLRLLRGPTQQPGQQQSSGEASCSINRGSATACPQGSYLQHHSL